MVLNLSKQPWWYDTTTTVLVITFIVVKKFNIKHNSELYSIILASNKNVTSIHWFFLDMMVKIEIEAF